MRRLIKQLPSWQIAERKTDTIAQLSRCRPILNPVKGSIETQNRDSQNIIPPEQCLPVAIAVYPDVFVLSRLRLLPYASTLSRHQPLSKRFLPLSSKTVAFPLLSQGAGGDLHDIVAGPPHHTPHLADVRKSGEKMWIKCVLRHC